MPKSKRLEQSLFPHRPLPGDERATQLFALEVRAAAAALDLRLDDVLTAELTQHPGQWAALPWVLCYLAMERRLAQGAYGATIGLGRAAARLFEQTGNPAGQARALAEVGIGLYFLGRYTAALDELSTCPLPQHPTAAAALSFALYLNHIGLDNLHEAVHAAQQGLSILDHERHETRRTSWRIVLQRNLVAAYHFLGDLDAARRAAEEAVALAATQHTNDYLYNWTQYEQAVLEQRAGRLDAALAILRSVRARLEAEAQHEPLWRWVAVAEGRALRDMGRLDEAEACFRAGGWGEGDEGPLLLWLLQGRHTEARCAAEAALAAASASVSPVVVSNLKVLLALLDLEAGATPAIQATLRQVADQFAALGFRHSRAGVLFHLAAVEYALGDVAAGDAALAEGLHFGAAQGYLNFDWWHPARMRTLLRHALDAGIEAEYSARLLHERGLEARKATTIALRCLGRFEVAIDGRPLPEERWRGHTAGTLRMQRMLLFLARHPGPQPLEAIARYVWPDKAGQIDIANNFHLTLGALRRVLEPDLAAGGESRFIHTAAQGYQLPDDFDATIDIDHLLDAARRAQLALAAGDHDGARAAFEQVERLYTGDFALARPAPGEAGDYRAVYHAAARWLAADALRRGAPGACIDRVRRLLQADPWDPDSPALLIEAYLARGDRRSARRQVERYLQVHGAPSPEIQALVKAHGL
jgi:DNA-binding SARP family transcriptional activator